MTTATATATITIDRHERDVLRRLLELGLSDDAINLDDLEHARTRRQEFEDGFAILDCIGWEEDDPRDTFELPLDPLRRFLEREKDDLSHHVAHEALACKRVRERDDGIMGPGEHPSEDWAAWEIHSDESLNRALEELHAIERVSRRLWWIDRGKEPPA